MTSNTSIMWILLLNFWMSLAIPQSSHAADKVAMGAPADTMTPIITLEASKSFARDHKILLHVKGLDKLKARVQWWVRSDDGRTAPDHEVFDDGRTCAVWGPPGKYEALVTVGIIEGSDIFWINIEHKFAIDGGNDPVDPDKPDPPSPPKPGQFGDVIAEVQRLAGPVRDDNKTEAAKIIAAAYRKHGAMAAKGEYADQNLLAEATSSEFVYELGLNRYLRWRPMQSRIREHMAKLMADGKLKDKDMDAWAALWEEYAKGFDEVAKEGNQNDKTKG